MTDFIDFPTLERPKSPNSYLLASADLCSRAAADQPSPHFSASPDQVFDLCCKIVDQTKNWTLVASDKTGRKLRFSAISPIMKFKDDVDILVVPGHADEGGTRLAVYSRSRVGYSDLGANAKRVAALLSALGKEGLSS